MTKKVDRITIGNKKLSLNDIWRLCLKMWKEIHKEFLIVSAKQEWLKENGFNSDIICASCFFCEWAKQNENNDINDFCIMCPGKLVSKRFQCENISYKYSRKPTAFYKKLLQLDKKRKNG